MNTNMHRLLKATTILLIASMKVATAAPYVPESDTEVLEQLPRTISAKLLELRTLRLALKADPRDVTKAVQLAQRYLALGRAESDPRYYGYAQAALQPWWDSASAPNAVLLVRASMRQNRHDFALALQDLERLLKSEPTNAHAWLTRAVVLQVQGAYEQAKQSCLPLLKLSDALTAMTCLSSVGALSGDARRSRDLLVAALQDKDGGSVEVRRWAWTTLAETAVRLGDNAEAEAAFRAALKLGDQDTYLIAAYADFLLDQRRPGEVIELIGDRTKIDGLLLRLALAEQQLGSPSLDAHIAALKARFEAANRRGESLHRGEEARFTLHLLDDPETALRLAAANWKTQCEPRDGRILLEAAVAAQQRAAASDVLALLHTSWRDDVTLRAIGTGD